MDEVESAIAWHTQLPVELYTAIGRVAHSTALLDAMLGEFIEELADSHMVWPLVSGQSTDWLIQTCRLFLSEADPQGAHYPEDFHDEIQRCLASIFHRAVDRGCSASLSGLCR
ncbi:hypothetical protein AB1K54_17210 [Microbacterium sp. BWT-B31]|uniref:hypothetical protein n=1 Tax=Microbacterium sp. BWT-B31 TaxID=3232072 RepID=UPI003527D461